MSKVSVFPLRRIGRLNVFAESNGDALTVQVKSVAGVHVVVLNHGKRTLQFRRPRSAERVFSWAELAALDIRINERVMREPIATFDLVLRDGEHVCVCRGAESEVEKVRDLFIQMMGLDRPAPVQAVPTWQPPPPPDATAVIAADARDRMLVRGAPPPMPIADDPWAGLETQVRIFCVGTVSFVAFIALGSLVRAPILFIGAVVAWIAIFSSQIASAFFLCPRCGKPFLTKFLRSSLFARKCVHCGLPRGDRV